MDTFKAVSRYDRSKNPEVKEYRYLTMDELKAFSAWGYHHSLAVDQHGKIARVAITSVQTWKTRPDVRIGWKFGLYEFGKELITSDNDNRFFVKEVE